MEYIKISDTTMKIVTPQPAKEEEVGLKLIQERIDIFEKQKVQLQGKIDELKAFLTEATKLGIKEEPVFVDEVIAIPEPPIKEPPIVK
jgi:hypothetical protein